MAEDLDRCISRGMKWSAVDQVAQEGVRVVSLVLLARLLSPADFGAVGLATIFTGFVAILAEFSLGNAIVQRKELTPDFLDTAFWFNLCLGIVACAAVWALATPIGKAYGQKELPILLRTAACGFLISPFGSVHAGLILRRMDFRGLAWRNFAALLAGGIVSAVLAWRGNGAISLVVGTLTTTATNSLLYQLASPWRPGRHFHKRLVREILSYSGNLSLSSFIGYWSRNLDQFLIGTLSGEHALGLYSRALSLLLLPLRKVAARVDAVLFPAFSSIQQDRARIGALYLKMTRLVALVTFPLSLGMWATAHDLIHVVFGPKWIEMEPLVLILCPLGAIQSMLMMGSSVYRATGNTAVALRITIFVTIGTSLSIVAGLYLGDVVGVAAGYAIFSVAAAPVIYLSAAKLIGLGLRAQIANLGGVLAITLTMAMAVLALAPLLGNGSTSLRLTAKVTIGIVVYWSLLHLFRVKAYAELLQLLGLTPPRWFQRIPDIGRTP